MTDTPILLSVDEDPAAANYLAERIYEFNAAATGYFDGRSFAATQRDDTGRIYAGVSGNTWGGCCTIDYLWVEASRRGSGLGAALLATAEAHARAIGCTVVVLSSHSFQAPGFYARMGYEWQASVRDQPVGHSNEVYTKRLDPA